jgi:membrane protease YdiL (CAAX protease family)
MLKQERFENLRAQIGLLFQREPRSAVIEALVFAGAIILWGLLPLPRSVLPLVAFAWLSLWLRQITWGEIGLRKPDRLLPTILVGAGVAAGAALAGWLVVIPAITHLSGAGTEIAGYSYLRGNAQAWIGLILVTWPLAAILEEMVYRGYFLNRLADQFGRRRGGWLLSLVCSSLVFALAHGQYTARFLVASFFMGLLEGSLYLVWGQNLWIPIVVHGMADTITFTLVFLGLI